jgi:hypothetical protein
MVALNVTRLIFALLTGAAVGLIGCGRGNDARSYSASAVFTERTALAEFAKNGVRVSVALESDEREQLVLRATFTPTEPGFHLYGKELPEDGVNGIGVPTRLELVGPSSLKAAGPLFSNITSHDLRVDSLRITLPVYREGPVILRLPIELPSRRQDVTAQVAVSYMACSTDGVCKIPVKKKILDIKIPAV